MKPVLRFLPMLRLLKADVMTMSAVIAAAGTTFLDFADPALAQDRIQLKLASSYSSTSDVLGENITRLIENIDVMSDGGFDIKFNEPGALVPALEVFDAVSKGSVDMAYTTTGFAAGKIPHMIFFASVPFGPNVAEYLAWIQAGGGKEIYDEEYAKHNIKGFQCGIVVAETAGWFKNEIKTLDDLKGLKMRFFGLGAKVMAKMGVSTQLLAGPDIYPALERGVIDAAEYSYPSIDKSAGFYQIAKHNYFPGWHQQASLVEVTVNLDVWNGLPASYQKMLEIGCNEANMWMMANAEARQAEAIAFHESEGVTVHTWPDEIIEAFRTAWAEVAEEESAADPNFKRIYDEYQSFREGYSKWREVGYLKD